MMRDPVTGEGGPRFEDAHPIASVVFYPALIAVLAFVCVGLLVLSAYCWLRYRR